MSETPHISKFAQSEEARATIKKAIEFIKNVHEIEPMTGYWKAELCHELRELLK